jgi:hypothetical protein
LCPVYAARFPCHVIPLFFPLSIAGI